MSDKPLADRLAEHTKRQFDREVGWGTYTPPVPQAPCRRMDDSLWPKAPAASVDDAKSAPSIPQP